jgi:hypothetical protein
MMRKVSALLAALAFTAVTLAPAAEAREGRRDGYHSGRHYRDYDRHRHYRHDDGDAVAAGVVGLVLGLAIGSLASQPREPQARCYDNYQRCAPPQQRGYYDRESNYDPRYDNERSAYERESGLEGGPQGSYDPYYEPQREQCMRRERQWDRYANQYVVVDIPC